MQERTEFCSLLHHTDVTVKGQDDGGIDQVDFRDLLTTKVLVNVFSCFGNVILLSHVIQGMLRTFATFQHDYFCSILCVCVHVSLAL